MQAQIPVMAQLAQPGSRHGPRRIDTEASLAIFMNASNNKPPDAVSDPALVHMSESCFTGRLLGQLHADRAAPALMHCRLTFPETGLQAGPVLPRRPVTIHCECLRQCAMCRRCTSALQTKAALTCRSSIVGPLMTATVHVYRTRGVHLRA
jgi:hypothetical protein